jgi:hypothetical protein
MILVKPENTPSVKTGFYPVSCIAKCFLLSRRDNTISVIYCLYETKAVIKRHCPPIEIGGYKYLVPNGTARLRNISEIDECTNLNSNSKHKLNITSKWVG